jgi:multicomponent K+:H+ antiporter subunit D
LSNIGNHLMIAPVAVPLFASAMMLVLGGDRRTLNATLNIASVVALVGIAIALLRGADAAPDGLLGVYRLGDWPAPFAIVLVVDRLTAMMLLLTSILASATLIFSLASRRRAFPFPVSASVDGNQWSIPHRRPL